MLDLKEQIWQFKGNNKRFDLKRRRREEEKRREAVKAGRENNNNLRDSTRLDAPSLFPKVVEVQREMKLR
jgi:hypothetical protein